MYFKFSRKTLKNPINNRKHKFYRKTNQKFQTEMENQEEILTPGRRKMGGPGKYDNMLIVVVLIDTKNRRPSYNQKSKKTYIKKIYI